MSSSLYSQYIQEREGKHILETLQGFATYTFTDKGVYIEDIFVLKDYRETGVASHLADLIIDIAKEKGHKVAFGSVSIGGNNSTASMKVLLAYGFKLYSANNNFILLSKDI